MMTRPNQRYRYVLLRAARENCQWSCTQEAGYVSTAGLPVEQQGWEECIRRDDRQQHYELVGETPSADRVDQLPIISTFQKSRSCLSDCLSVSSVSISGREVRYGS